MKKTLNRREALKSFGAAWLAPAFISLRGGSSDRVFPLSGGQADPKYRPIEKPLECVIVGAGNRGWLYSQYAARFPHEMKVVGIAEPVPLRQEKFKKEYALDESRVFTTWEHVFDRPKFADFVIVSTIDKHHYGAAMRALEAGYHVLLEKAIAQSWKECRDIRAQAKKYGRIVGICHVLRYAPYFIKMREVIRSGDIGEVLSIQHLEPIGNIHFSHSFVRGNWRNERESTPILLSKSCHDLDLFYWMLGSPCRSVTSFGRLDYFRRERAPAGNARRCADGCRVESTCPYSALRIYLRERIWGVGHVIDLQPWDEGKVSEALREGPYGRCVFHSDNDVPDHQVVNLEFGEGVTVAFSMEAHTSYMGRRTRIMGTRGDIVGDEQALAVTEFSRGESTAYTADELSAAFAGGGHGGGDWRLVRAFLQAVYQNDESLLTSTIEDSMESHRIGFEAEVSRKAGGRLVNLKDA